MELKRLITHFSYRIEPKPEGGFVAHASDPTLPPLEASTREELQQKIQANIVNALTTEFPGLKLPLENKQRSYAFHIENKPEGGFAIHSADPNAKPIEGASHAEIENQFAEKLINFVGKHVTPELSKALAASGATGDVHVFVNTTTGVKVAANSQDLKFSNIQVQKPNFNNAGDAVGNSPITPEAGNWNFFRLLLALLVIAAVMYFFLHHR